MLPQIYAAIYTVMGWHHEPLDKVCKFQLLSFQNGSWGQHGAHLRPVGPRRAPCRPYEPCYQGLPVQFLSAMHVLIWFRTFFIVEQWGIAQGGVAAFSISRRRHLWTCSSNTSCCWISLRFSGSHVDGVKPLAASAVPYAQDTTVNTFSNPWKPCWKYFYLNVFFFFSVWELYIEMTVARSIESWRDMRIPVQVVVRATYVPAIETNGWANVPSDHPNARYP